MTRLSHTRNRRDKQADYVTEPVCTRIICAVSGAVTVARAGLAPKRSASSWRGR